jgi:hypothetical protein
VAVGAAEEGEQEQVKSGAMRLGKLEVVMQDVFDVSHGEHWCPLKDVSQL